MKYFLFNLLYLTAAVVVGQEATVTLADSGSTDGLRWLDVADNEYATAYQGSYDYSQATVQVTNTLAGERFSGTLTATNLKPNFAYQIKLVGTPGMPGSPEATSNENIGYAGRWWEEEWDGAVWQANGNLNNKGNGTSPNPNDDLYNSRKDILDPGSPTGRRYRYTGYCVFAYFITDEDGDATVSFVLNNSYHVLWKTSQRAWDDDGGDGPIVAHTFDPYPLSEDAYTVDYDLSSARVFGEWERLPHNGIALAVGSYTAQFLLTEESFHGSGTAGNWAAAMQAGVDFDIIDTPSTAPVIAVSGDGEPIVNGDLSPSLADGTDFFTVRVTDESRDREFTIANSGNTDLQIESVQITGEHPGDFLVAAAPAAAVGAGGQTVMTLRFDPTATGERRAVVQIYSNDDDRTPFEFAVRGDGLAGGGIIFLGGSSGGCRTGRPAAGGLWVLLILSVSVLALRRFAFILRG